MLDNEELELFLLEVEEGMQKTIASFHKIIAKIRTGRANPDLVNDIMVNYYGNKTPLKQTSVINIPEHNQILIKPYDKSTIGDIMHAINKNDSGLNPKIEVDYIRIIIPNLTEEVRQNLIKKLMTKEEHYKIEIRNHRRSALQKIKKFDLGNDLTKDNEQVIQKLTDRFINKLDKITKNKKKQLMTI